MADRDAVGVLLVCEDTLERAGLKALLGGSPDIKVVGEAFSLAGLPQLVVKLNPDVILDIERSLDARTVDSVTRVIRYVNSVTSARMIILAVAAPGELAIDLMRGGRCAVLDKMISSEELIAAIRIAVAGYLPVKEKLMVNLARATTRAQGSRNGADEHLRALTRQQRRVLTLIIQGLSNPEIAAELTLAESTVKSHVQRILKTLGLRDRAHIIIYAYEEGLIHRLRQTSALLPRRAVHFLGKASRAHVRPVFLNELKACLACICWLDDLPAAGNIYSNRPNRILMLIIAQNDIVDVIGLKGICHYLPPIHWRRAEYTS